MQDNQLIALRQFMNPDDANDAAILLESEGIEATLTNVVFEPNSCRLIDDAEPASLHVQAADVDLAESLLSDLDAPSEEERAREEEGLLEAARRQEYALAEMRKRIATNPERLVTIRNYWEPYESNLAANVLESNLIFTSLSNETFAHNAWHYAVATKGVGLQIRANDLEFAETLLQEIEDSSHEDEENTDYDPFSETPNSPEEIARESRQKAVVAFCFICLHPIGSLIAFYLLLQSYKDIEAYRDEAGLDGLSGKAARTIRRAWFLNCTLISLFACIALWWVLILIYSLMEDIKIFHPRPLY